MSQTAQTLTDRYLKAVAAQLPQATRDDIIAELADAIADRMEAREEDLGRPLTEDEQEAVLREMGHPLSVAARYGSGPQHVVGPELYPWWMFGLKVGIGVMIALTLLGLAVRVLSGDILAGQAIGQAFADVFSSAITLIGFATIAAFIIERQKEKPAFLRDWRVKDLGLFEWAAFDHESFGRKVADSAASTTSKGAYASSWGKGGMPPVAGALASAVAWFVFLLWWTGLFRVVPVSIGDLGATIDGIDYSAILNQIAAALYWPVIAYAVARIVFGLFRAWRPEAVRLTGLGDLLLAGVRMAFCSWLLTASTLSPLIRPAGLDDFIRRVQLMFHEGQGALSTLLTIIVIIAFVTAAWEAVTAATRLIGGKAAVGTGPRAA